MILHCISRMSGLFSHKRYIYLQFRITNVATPEIIKSNNAPALISHGSINPGFKHKYLVPLPQNFATNVHTWLCACVCQRVNLSLPFLSNQHMYTNGIIFSSPRAVTQTSLSYRNRNIGCHLWTLYLRSCDYVVISRVGGSNILLGLLVGAH